MSRMQDLPRSKPRFGCCTAAEGALAIAELLARRLHRSAGVLGGTARLTVSVWGPNLGNPKELQLMQNGIILRATGDLLLLFFFNWLLGKISTLFG